MGDLADQEELARRMFRGLRSWMRPVQRDRLSAAGSEDSVSPSATGCLRLRVDLVDVRGFYTGI